MASEKFCALKINFAIGFTQKLAGQTSRISKFTCISSASLPAVRPGSTRCWAPEILHNKGNGGGFTKMLF